MSRNKKLVLFDIDGTLVQTDRQSVEQWRIRVVEVFKHVYRKDLPVDFDLARVNGKVERRYFREIAEMLGVSKDDFEKKFPIAAEHFHELLKHHITEKNINFTKIREAADLVGQLENVAHIHMGLVTGNIEKNAWLKLKSADFDTPFAVGGFGDNVEDRGDLVLEAIQNAERHFGVGFSKTDIIVIGDTIHDIASAKKAGVVSIGVATGMTEGYDDLVAAGGDIVVNTLTDAPIYELLHIPKSNKKQSKK
jgi:phosphoglycolate phosphatase-like HAD superfamily hydrolase